MGDTLTSRVKTLLNVANSPTGSDHVIIRYSPIGQSGWTDADDDGVRDNVAAEKGKAELQFVIPSGWTAPRTDDNTKAGYVQVKQLVGGAYTATPNGVAVGTIKISTNTVTVSDVYFASSAEKIEFQYFLPTTSGRAVDTTFGVKHASNGGTLVTVNDLVYNLGGAEDGIGSAIVEIMGKADSSDTANVDERRTIAAGTSGVDIQVTITAEADIINKEIEIIVPARDKDATKTAEYSMGQPQTSDTSANAYVMPLVAGVTLLNGADAQFATSIDASTGLLRPGVFGQKIQLKVNKLAYSSDDTTRPKILVQIKNVKIPSSTADDTYTFTVGSRESESDLNFNAADKKFAQGNDTDKDGNSKNEVAYPAGLEVIGNADNFKNTTNLGADGRNNDLSFLEDKHAHLHSDFHYGDLTIVVQPVAGEGVAKVGSMQSGNYNQKYITNTASTYNLTLTYEATTEISDVWFDVPAGWTLPDFAGNKIGTIETTPTQGVVSASSPNDATPNISISVERNLLLEVTDQAAVGYSDNIAKLNQNRTGNVGNVDQN